jgi:hypothetical protein
MNLRLTQKSLIENKLSTTFLFGVEGGGSGPFSFLCQPRVSMYCNQRLTEALIF